jgi:hypothetical protein
MKPPTRSFELRPFVPIDPAKIPPRRCEVCGAKIGKSVYLAVKDGRGINTFAHPECASGLVVWSGAAA